MADSNSGTVVSPKPRRRLGWLKVLGGIFAVLLILLVVAYFVGTSAGFLKGVILPRASKSMNADITVTDASIHPFSSVELKDLKVTPRGAATLLTAPLVSLRYSLMDIIKGRINVDDVTVNSPTITLVENADGTSNLDPILKASKEEPAKGKETPGEKAEPAQIDIKKVSITGATIKRTKIYDPSHQDVIELSNANLTLENLKNAQTGKLALGADIRVQNAPPAPGTNGALQAKLAGNFDLGLSADLKPSVVKGATHLEVVRAEGALATAAGFSGDLESDLTPTEIKNATLRFAKGGTSLGQIQASGPYNMEKNEGRISLSVRGIDKRLLDIFAAGSGMDFRDTAINSTNEIQLADSGKVITAQGQLNVEKFQLARTNQVTPVLDLRAAYSLVVDTGKSNVLVNGLTVTGTQSGNPLLNGQLTSPMAISWGGAAGGVGDSTLTMQLTRLNLADWKAFAGDSVNGGIVSSDFKLTSQQGGKKLGFDLNTTAENLDISAGTNRVSGVGVTFLANGAGTDLRKFDLTQIQAQMARGNQKLLTMTASGTYVLASTTNDPPLVRGGIEQPQPASADIAFTLQALLSGLVQLMPQPDMNVASGTADMKGRFTQKGDAQAVVGNLALSGFTAQVGANSFSNFATTADFDVGLTPQEIQLRKLNGALSEGGAPGGGFDLSGTVNRTNNAARIAAKLRDFNQNGLRPFLESAFAGKKLVSLALNGDAAVNYDPQGASTIKSDVAVTNLVVVDPANPAAPMRLDAKLGVDLALAKDILEIKQCQLGLARTERAANVMQLSGRVDMSRTNATQGNLKLAADSLDLTSYYDAFAAATNAPAPATAAPPAQRTGTTPAQPEPEKEPEPTILPVRDFTVEAAIGKLFLHEIQITNLQTVLKLDGGKVLLKPCSLALNGAPVEFTADVDLGVPGYKYDTAFRAMQVPLAPIVNSLKPEQRGKLSGTMTGTMQVSGAGTTGASLQKNLKGNFDIGSTNLNLAIQSLRSPLFKKIINVVAVVPELVRNPNAAIGTLAGALFGGGSSGANAWSEELAQSPIDVVQAKGVMGQGRVNLEHSLIQSLAFQAGAHGTVTLAPQLTNSALNLPLIIAVKQSLAQKINMVPAGTPTNATYVKLPDYVSITGTVGSPDQKINKAALLGTALQQLGGNIPGVDQKTGQLLQNLGGALTRPRGSTTNTAGTNAPAGGIGGLLQGLGGGLRTPAAATNAPSTSTNRPATNQDPVGGLLNQLLRPKK
jgi:hypothetical protein